MVSASQSVSGTASWSPPDAAERRRITEDLDTTLLVEAAAGTGKTTSMVARMVNLLARGRAQAESVVAVTFTRKAAAELRGRFQAELERTARAASGDVRERLHDAVAQIDRLFIGTIHSFCGRLLRERPVEAGVDIDFVELDDVADAELRRQAWSSRVDELFARDDSLLDELDQLGLDVDELEEAFAIFAEYPDVDDWPAPPVSMPDLAPLRRQLLAYIEHMRELSRTLTQDPGRDQLIPRYHLLPRMARQLDLDEIKNLLAILEQFQSTPSVVQRSWPSKELAKAEADKWSRFAAQHARPALMRWREHRYGAVMRVIAPARAIYDRLRRQAGGLNYQDLLIKAANLLRNQPAVRGYFRKRFTHLLVDEFQDTDPIQAQVMLYLTADDIQQTNWRHCRPAPGSLFVVGDPKQSIYRFRRADIQIYEQVKQIIRKSGGEVVELTTNFRTITALLDWINATFHDTFPEEATEHMPARRPMHPGRPDNGPEDHVGVAALRLAHCSKQEQLLAYEVTQVVQFIRQAITSGRRQPGDFLIVTRTTKHLQAYSRRLEEERIPHQVSGGAALSDAAEVVLLHRCLLALTRPDDPVALVGVLRGELFGLSDVALYAFKRAGGRFSLRAPFPEQFQSSADAGIFLETFERLQRYQDWLARLPAVAAIERISRDLGLPARAAAAGTMRAGTLGKAMAALRARRDLFSAAEVVAYLGEMIQSAAKLDGMPAQPHDGSAVRIMNLHKVKGLEAPVVFLACPFGNNEHPVKYRIERLADTIRGYMAIYGRHGFYRQLLACPPGWCELQASEKAFLDAEELRLLYVAATRAKVQLVITLGETFKHLNPWRFFEGALADRAALTVAEKLVPPMIPMRTLTADDISQVQAGIDERWRVLRRPSYTRQAAKQLTIARGKRARAAAEHGTEWGTVIHFLLQIAMARPDVDLREQARACLAENDLAAERADEALAVVRSVMRSEIWRRALASPRRLVEVPFQLPAASDGPSKTNLMVGVIDLAFRETAGWVLVDYKTDRKAGGSAAELVSRYRHQMQVYAHAWRHMVAEPVAETGLYFTRTGRYVVIEPSTAP
jgi:ATP-dependent helicase/nuclease subunit A